MTVHKLKHSQLDTSENLMFLPDITIIYKNAIAVISFVKDNVFCIFKISEDTDIF